MLLLFHAVVFDDIRVGCCLSIVDWRSQSLFVHCGLSLVLWCLLLVLWLLFVGCYFLMSVRCWLLCLLIAVFVVIVELAVGWWLFDVC